MLTFLIKFYFTPTFFVPLESPRASFGRSGAAKGVVNLIMAARMQSPPEQAWAFGSDSRICQRARVTLRRGINSQFPIGICLRAVDLGGERYLSDPWLQTPPPPPHPSIYAPRSRFAKHTQLEYCERTNVS